MKKILSIGFAIALSATICTSVDASASTDLDALSYNSASPSIKRSLQNNYHEALQLRYRYMYNRARHHRDYYNSFLQDYRVNQLKKENNVTGSLGSDMNREGEMETGKERVRVANRNRVQAVNQKSVFRKRAINYYLDGGNADSSIMEMGNVDGMNNVVARRKMLGDIYKISIGATNLTTRDMVRNIGLHRGNTGVTKRATYSTGGFNNRMTSPFMSTRWMD